MDVPAVGEAPDVAPKACIDLRTEGRAGHLCAYRRLRLDLYSCRRHSRIVPRRRRAANPCAAAPPPPASDAGTQSRRSSLQSVSTIGDAAEEDDDEFDKFRGDLNPSQSCYLNGCKKMHVTPSHKFLQALRSEQIALRGHDLGGNGASAVAAALTKNASIRFVDFTDNNMCAAGAEAMASMLQENIFITDLRIVENNIGEQGLRKLVEALLENDYITTLDLSGNRLEEGSAQFVAFLLKKNTVIVKLSLAHNNFREKGAIEIAYGIAANESVLDLDLSWNHVRRDGAIAICDALGTNSTLRSLNLSWNGLHMQGCLSLAKALGLNSSLKTLDLTCNRMDFRGLEQLMRGLRLNRSLQVLKIGRNPITSDGIRNFLRRLDACKDSGVAELFVTGLSVDKQTIELAAKLAEKRPFSLNFGTLLRQEHKEREDTGLFDDDPMIVLMEFMKLKNMRLVDLFLGLDTDNSRSLSHKEFRDGLLALGVPMSPNAVDRLIRKLDQDRNGEVEFSELMMGQRDYKRRMKRLAIEEKFLPYEETKVGKVNRKLRVLLSLKDSAAKKDRAVRRAKSPKLTASFSAAAASVAFTIASRKQKERK